MIRVMSTSDECDSMVLRHAIRIVIDRGRKRRLRTRLLAVMLAGASRGILDGALPDTAGRPREPMDSGSVSWVRGIEFGLLSATMRDDAEISAYPVHADMIGEARNMAARYGRTVTARPHQRNERCASYRGAVSCTDGEAWLDITISPRPGGGQS